MVGHRGVLLEKPGWHGMSASGRPKLRVHAHADYRLFRSVVLPPSVLAHERLWYMCGLTEGFSVLILLTGSNHIG
jgi:hypothetical protein